MNVTISVPGTFHAFHLAEQLEKKDALNAIYTTHPRFKIDTSLPDSHVRPIHHPEAINQVLQRLPVADDALGRQAWKPMLFDRAVARRLVPANGGLFVGFAGAALRSIRRANELGLTTVVERSSSHIRTQARILAEEYAEFDAGSPPIDESYIEHEEAEYDVADFIAVPSEFVYDSFLEQGVPERKLICEPLGVDVEWYCPGSGNEKRDDGIEFLFAGLVGVRKGVHHLLNAWKRSGVENKCTLRIAGRITETGSRLIDQFEIDESVEITGFVDGSLSDVYQDVSVFVLPSVEDGFGLVVLEAMASGLPVIITEQVGAKDCVVDGEHGFIVPAGDANAIADRMRFFYENPEQREQMGQDAREHVSRKYTWNDYCGRIFNTYQSLLND